jgi:hypothetical protein
MAGPIHKVPISINELSTHSCNINAVFKKFIIEIKTRMPFLKLEYAYINTDDPFERIGMMCLFSFKAENGPVGTIKKYMIFISNTFSYFSLAGFDICRERGELDKWFQEFTEKPVVYPEMFLKDIINDSDNKLTWYKTADHPERYWKDPKNAKTLAEHLDIYASSFEAKSPRR